MTTALKGLGEWATIKSPKGLRITDHLNPATLNPKNVIVVANTRKQAMHYAEELGAPEARWVDVNNTTSLRGISGVQAICWHPQITLQQQDKALMDLAPAMFDAPTLLPNNFYPRD